jgi:hypothetical protein
LTYGFIRTGVCVITVGAYILLLLWTLYAATWDPCNTGFYEIKVGDYKLNTFAPWVLKPVL